MSKEFVLSEKRKGLIELLKGKGLMAPWDEDILLNAIYEQDREFIRLLKEGIARPFTNRKEMKIDCRAFRLIDKLAGDKLTK